MFNWVNIKHIRQQWRLANQLPCIHIRVICHIVRDRPPNKVLSSYCYSNYKLSTWKISPKLDCHSTPRKREIHGQRWNTSSLKVTQQYHMTCCNWQLQYILNLAPRKPRIFTMSCFHAHTILGRAGTEWSWPIFPQPLQHNNDAPQIRPQAKWHCMLPHTNNWPLSWTWLTTRGDQKSSRPDLVLFRIKLKYYLLLIVARLRTRHAQYDFW